MSLTDNGVKVDWRSLDSLSALIYSDSQRAIAGAASIEIDKADTTSLLIEYAGYQPQYDGLARLIIRCLYKGAEKTFDAPVCDFVSTTAEATGITVINDPELDVHLTVTEVSTSILDAAIAAAFDGASEANTAAAAATTAAQAATDAASGATAAINDANAAAIAANSATKSATEATENLVAAGESATNATVNANNAASLARDAAQSVEAVKTAAQAATKAANTAADSATTAANDASKAAQSATNAAIKANEAAIKANEAAIKADEAFQSAEQSRQATFAASESARDADFQSKEAERDAAMQTISQEAQKLTELQSKIDSKQDTISDLETIREGAALGKTALQKHQDISGLATKEEVAGKQDTISDLDIIRKGASKGATALQDYTESDPIYTADKPKLALKSEIPDISGKADKTAIVTEAEGNASYTISPNVLTKLGTLASSVILSLDTSKEESGVANVYDIIFVTPADAPSITWPEGISWVGGSAPAIAGGKTYEVSIMDNLATYGEY